MSLPFHYYYPPVSMQRMAAEDTKVAEDTKAAVVDTKVAEADITKVVDTKVVGEIIKAGRDIMGTITTIGLIIVDMADMVGMVIIGMVLTIMGDGGGVQLAYS